MLYLTLRRLCIVPLLGFSLVSATTPPDVPNMRIIWKDSFTSCANCSPNFSEWNIRFGKNINKNNELQTYTDSSSNLRLSGNQTLQIIPWMWSQQWTSSRIESKGLWTPSDGKVMQIQASFRTGIGKEASKQGMWPAFWMLGESSRYGTRWPQCGEIDIFEQINGVNNGYGTVHGGTSVNVTYDSQQAAIVIPDDDNFHTWSLKIDRTSGNWQEETLQWFMDGQEFNSLTGAAVNDQEIWSTLAWSPLYVIINLAVGGNWPGYPNDATQDGYNSMMEVQYVAVYETL